MAFCDGETLKERLERGVIPTTEAVRLAAQIARGLARAHQAGIVHRDVKPGNIMVTTDGDAKLLDFGIAKASGGADMTRTGTTVGTVAYMAPEHVRGGTADARSDVWSLGVVLYEMLAGRTRSPAATITSCSHSNRRTAGAAAAVRRASTARRYRLSSARSECRDRRFANAGEMASALEQCSSLRRRPPS